MLLPLLAVIAPAAAADVRAPQSQLWVAYEPFMELWGRSAPDGNEDIIVTAGHGRPPVFAIALVGRTLQRLQIRTPGYLDGHRIRAEPGYPPPEVRDQEFREATADYGEIEGPLVHHRPAIALLSEMARCAGNGATRRPDIGPASGDSSKRASSVSRRRHPLPASAETPPSIAATFPRSFDPRCLMPAT